MQDAAKRSGMGLFMHQRDGDLVGLAPGMKR